MVRLALPVSICLGGCTTGDGSADSTLASALYSAAGQVFSAIVNAAVPVIVQFFQLGILSIAL